MDNQEPALVRFLCFKYDIGKKRYAIQMDIVNQWKLCKHLTENLYRKKVLHDTLVIYQYNRQSHHGNDFFLIMFIWKKIFHTIVIIQCLVVVVKLFLIVF